jgi:hypothetical protein
MTFIPASNRPTNRSRTRVAAAAAGLVLGCTPALLRVALPTGSKTPFAWLSVIANSFGTGPGDSLAVALGAVGAALLLVGAFATQATGYQTVLEDQLEFALTTFIFIATTLLAIAVLEAKFGDSRHAAALLLLDVVPGCIALALLYAPKLLRELYSLRHIPAAARWLLAIGGAAALSAAVARLVFRL